MLIRSLRSISNGYKKDNFTIYDETEPSAHILLETSGNGIVQSDEIWPESIVLSASLEAIEIKSNAIFERSTGSKLLAKFTMYSSPKIDKTSNISNCKSCCSQIRINFENAGYMFIDNEKHQFFGKQCEEYSILSANTLFTKDFLTTQNDVHEVINSEGIVFAQNKIAGRIMYPYGGFYEYGVHPKTIESCICSVDHNTNALKINQLSSIKTLDPTVDFQLSSGKYFIGVKNFTNSQKMTLYDEIVSGNCKITIQKNDQTRFSNAPRDQNYSQNSRCIHLRK